MRLTTLILVLVLTGFVLFLAGWFRPQATPAAAASPAPAPASVAAFAPLDEPPIVTVAAPRSEVAAPSQLLAAALPDAQSVENRIAELETLALNDDVLSLNLILLALSDANPAIRAAALESTVQFGSLDALPTLQVVLAKTVDSQERVNLHEAIEFLKLPPLAASASPQP
jgi:hypothetical protein